MYFKNLPKELYIQKIIIIYSVPVLTASSLKPVQEGAGTCWSIASDQSFTGRLVDTLRSGLARDPLAPDSGLSMTPYKSDLESHV